FSGSFDNVILGMDGEALHLIGSDGIDSAYGIERLQFAADDGAVLVVGAGGYATMAAPLLAAIDGGTIPIADGTVLREQVTIDGFSNLTILGMGDGSVIEMPDDPTYNEGDIGSKDRAAVISVNNSTNVTIKDLFVDARGMGDD